jgi:hypothetical protein
VTALNRLDLPFFGRPTIPDLSIREARVGGLRNEQAMSVAEIGAVFAEVSHLHKAFVQIAKLRGENRGATARSSSLGCRNFFSTTIKVAAQY